MANEFPEATAQLELDHKQDPTPRATRNCAEWLHQCLQIGWPKSSLDDLEKLWWKYHDIYGNPIT